jgi:NTE family protein
MRAFVVFEGGGARGVAHVGALRILEDNEIHVSGWSGTSAGSIIATLACVGFKSTDLIGPDGTSPLIEKINNCCSEINVAERPQPSGLIARLKAAGRGIFREDQPAGAKPLPTFRKITDMLGRWRWRRLRVVRAIAAILGNRWVRLVALLAMTVALFLSFAAIWVGSPDAGAAAVFLSFVLIAVLGTLTAIATGIFNGLVGLGHFRRCFNLILLWQLEKKDGVRREHDSTVTFETLHNAPHCQPLKIVATDIVNQTVRVFSYETTPEVAVADAVCASICIPMVFKPWRIREDPRPPGFFLDGGLLSNLPVWTLDDERNIDPEAWTLAITLKAPNEPGKLRAGIVSAIRTVVFGSSVLDRRGVSSLRVVTLPVELGLLSFDASPDEIRRCVDEAADAARLAIEVKLIKDAAAYRKACEVARDYAVSIFSGVAADVLLSRPDRQIVRASMIFAESSNPDGLRESRPKMLRIRYGAGFETALDDGMILPISGSIAGQVWRSREPAFHFTIAPGKTLLNDPSLPADVALSGDENRRRRRLVRQDIRWVLAMPVFKKGPDGRRSGDIAFILSLDGDGRLDGTKIDDVKASFNLIHEWLDAFLYEFYAEIEQ